MITRLLRTTADNIDAGTCELSEDEALDLASIFSHQSLSKEQACEYLNLRRSRFDDLVRDNIIPKGKKRKGITGLYWYKDELDKVRIGKN